MLFGSLRSTLLLGALLAWPAVASAGGDRWMADLEPALEVARQQGKDLLVDFTGSDWCGWCIRLDKEVFSQQDFIDYAGDKFVLVALDFPREDGEAWNAMTDELRGRNEKERQHYGVQGFPTILLLSPDGVEYGRTGYREGGPQPYTEHLDEMRDAAGTQARENVATLRNAEGDAKLEAAYALWNGARPAMREEILAIVRAQDPDDSRNLLLQAELDGIVNGELQKEDPDFEAVESGLAALATRNPKAETIPQFQFTRSWVALQRGDLDTAQACADKFTALEDADPEMAAWLAAQLQEASGESEG